MTSSSMEIQWDIVLDLSYSGDSGGKTLSKVIDIWRKEPTPKWQKRRSRGSVG